MVLKFMCKWIFKVLLVKKKETSWPVSSSKDKNHRTERQCSKPMKGSHVWKNILAILNNI